MSLITQVESKEQITAVQNLFREYIAWTNTLVDSRIAPTFEGFGAELATLPGIYAPPTGRLLLAMQDDQPAGCVALKGQSATVGELKRLYVRPAFRGRGLGQQLVTTLMHEAGACGYQRVVLDSLRTMTPAHAIYWSVGFKTVETPNNFPDALKSLVVFMECELVG